jgi:phosphatidate cytidylyltransferase
MILTYYLIILAYFSLGIVAFYFINRKKEKKLARRSWKKTIIYFFIIQIIFFSIFVNPLVFRCIAVFIIILGLYELFKLFRESEFKRKSVFYVSLLVYSVFSLGFYIFSGMDKEIIFFAFAILSIFDSFSQITGQLWGRKKLFPGISPEKTIAGLIGGMSAAMLSVLIFKNLVYDRLTDAMIMGAGVAFFAFIGDASGSCYKRKYNVKDFSNLIPQHGGILDRFDSLIAGGAWVTLYVLLVT